MSSYVKRWGMVRPAEETPRRRLWLSRLDSMMRSPFRHSSFIYIFNHPHYTKDYPSQSLFFDNAAANLKDALSRALVSFYPMAGRLRRDEGNGGCEINYNDDGTLFVEGDGRYEIECNEEGALFVVAETAHTLAGFGHYLCKPSAELERVTIPTWDYSKGLSSIPLLMVQLTRFACGGLTVTVAHHHHVCDGPAQTHFMKSWCRLARGDLGIELEPFHERLTPRQPPQVMFPHLEYHPPLSLNSPPGQDVDTRVVVSCFKLSKDQIKALIAQATTEEDKVNRSEAVCGHVWRCTSKARGLSDDQEIRVLMQRDGRPRLENPRVPEGYCGNVIFFSACIAKAGEITRKPLSFAAKLIKKSNERMSEEYLRSAIDYLETRPDPDALVRGNHTVASPNMSINYMAKLPAHEMDFGWGRPSQFSLAHSGAKREGQAIILRSPDDEDGGLSLIISLYSSHMLLFEKFFYTDVPLARL